MIISNPACSPFVIACSEVNDVCSVSFIDVVYSETENRTLLQLTTSSSIHQFTSAQPTCFEMNADVSANCYGLSIDDHCLIPGTVDSSLPPSPLLNTMSLIRYSALQGEVWFSHQLVRKRVGGRTIFEERGVDSITENRSSARTSPSRLRRLLQQNHPEIQGIAQNHVTFNSVFHHKAPHEVHFLHTADLLSNGPASLYNVLFVKCYRPHFEIEVSCAVRLADYTEFIMNSVMFRGADSSEGKDVVFHDRYRELHHR
ncbi:hypothetical protein BLNAU_22406 [Blattamonas nauphoetae]|uniref:Uncharacterized protein n=1 Tax=Blattamonas nauphoetae TaxID=2049346 RepID=A0ABQ9WT50_9EUKA|nr:hypothetical protein BLNAU_22406 [Blattamonas nauphoetae]